MADKDTKNILKDALSKLDSTQKTDKSVASGAKSSQPDVSKPNGGGLKKQSETNETGISESEKSAATDAETTDKSAEDSASEATKSDHAAGLQHGMKQDTNTDNGGHSDANEDDDDDDEDDESMNGKEFAKFCKSINAQSDTVKSFGEKIDKFDETMKSLPNVLAEALSKSIDESIKSVIETRNTKDLTRSEKDMDGSQDQSQKDTDDDDTGEDDVDESVAPGKNKTDLTHSEKSAAPSKAKQIDSSDNKTDGNGNPEATAKSVNKDNKEEAAENVDKSLSGNARAVQESAPEPKGTDTTDTVTKSTDGQEIETPAPLTPNDIVSKSLEIESGIADKKANINPNNVRAWDTLDSVYKLAKSARDHISEDSLKKAQEAFDKLK